MLDVPDSFFMQALYQESKNPRKIISRSRIKLIPVLTYSKSFNYAKDLVRDFIQLNILAPFLHA